MGNLKSLTSRNTVSRNSNDNDSDSSGNMSDDKYTSVDDFIFHEPLEEDSTNGLFLNGTYIPEEILTHILSFVPPDKLLPLSLVCKKWCNVIKCEILWMEVYKREHSGRAKLLPWYVYYLYYNTDNFTNLLKNVNGEDKFNHWKIIRNLGDEFRIEASPCGSDPLPEGVEDFNGNKSCFATSYYECIKSQELNLVNKRLFRYVINKHKPHIYISEWVAARFDCGCMYRLRIRGYGATYTPNEPALYHGQYFDSDEDEEERAREEQAGTLFEKSITRRFEQWSGRTWEKVEMLIDDYPKNLTMLVFEHEGRDTQFWKGHYGSKMAGGVVKFLFDSIKPDIEIT